MNGIYDFPYVTIDASYYQMFRSVRRLNVEMNRLLSDRSKLFSGMLHRRYQGRAIRVLALGSATPRNMRYIQYFVRHRLEVDLAKSGIYMIDRDDRALIPHHEYAMRAERFPRVHVIGANVIAHPFAPGSMDLILSDYTGSFMVEEETWDAFFREIGSSLAKDGCVLINCFVSREEERKPLLYRSHEGWTRVCVSQWKLFALIKESGLSLTTAHYRPAQYAYEGRAAFSATFVLERA